MQASVISCFLILRNSDLKLGLLLFEPAIVIEDELLHLLEKPERTTVNSLHRHEEIADLILQQIVSLLEFVNHLRLNFAR